MMSSFSPTPLDPLQAAVLRVKLSRLDEWNARRAAIAARYAAGLAGAALSLPAVPDWADPAWHLYVVRHPRRDALLDALAAAGIGCLVHYPIPPHRQAAYPEFAAHALPVAERLAGEVLSLPIGPHLSAAQADRVIAAVRAGTEALA